MKSLFMASVSVCAAVLTISSHGFAAAGRAPFYEDKTLTVVVATGAGGTGALRAQAVVQSLQKHLRGNPAVVYKFMRGGGGIKAANHLAHSAGRDGLTIGWQQSSFFSHVILGSPGVRYKIEDFEILGSAVSEGGPYTLQTRPGLGIDSVEKLRAFEEPRFAQRSVGHSMYVLDRMFAFFLDLKDPKWVLGYNPTDIRLALERGEADVLTVNIYQLMRETPRLVKDTLPIVMSDVEGRGADAVAGFPKGRPTIDKYVDTEVKRDLRRFRRGIRPASGPFLVPKGIPAEALAALRDAFNKVWADRQFAKDYHRLTTEVADPVTGEEIEQALRDMPKDPKIKELYTELAGRGPMPRAE